MPIMQITRNSDAIKWQKTKQVQHFQIKVQKLKKCRLSLLIEVIKQKKNKANIADNMEF